MLFSSIFFIFCFLPVALLVYFSAPSDRLRNGVLLVLSCVFYFWGEGLYIAVMFGSILIAWYFGRRIDDAPTEARRRSQMRLGVSLAVLLLLVFKYTNFIVSNLLEAANDLGLPVSLVVPKVHLPIGISFFTFQVISYLIDIHRREFPAQRSLTKVALYKTFFPQLIAGPIVRYKDVRNQIDHRRITLEDMATGFTRFVIGLAQKVLIANTLGSIADKIFKIPAEHLGITAAWIGAAAYFFQIYFDFAGYSNMAIGLGRLFGFRFLENFDAPYVSRSITEFWRRWHISARDG